MLRRTDRSEGRTILRSAEPLENFPRNAQRRFLRLDVSYVESLLRIERFEFRSQSPSAHRDRTDAAPLAIAFLKDLCNGFLRGLVALECHRAPIGIDNF